MMRDGCDAGSKYIPEAGVVVGFDFDTVFFPGLGKILAFL